MVDGISTGIATAAVVEAKAHLFSVAEAADTDVASAR